MTYYEINYDGIVGHGNNQPDPAIITVEIDKLVQHTDRLKIFVDEHIAHTAIQRATALPRFQDLDDAIDLLEALVKRYMHLFRGAGIQSLLPVWQYDWKEIFHFPWIDDGATPIPTGAPPNTQ